MKYYRRNFFSRQLFKCWGCQRMRKGGIMKKILLCRTTYLVEISHEHEGKSDDELLEIENLISTDFSIDGVNFKWISSTPTLLNTSSSNIGKCSNCGAWTTDCALENPVNELSYGTHIHGQLLCDLCLPGGHPLRFSSWKG